MRRHTLIQQCETKKKKNNITPTIPDTDYLLSIYVQCFSHCNPNQKQKFFLTSSNWTVWWTKSIIKFQFCWWSLVEQLQPVSTTIILWRSRRRKKKGQHSFTFSAFFLLIYTRLQMYRQIWFVWNLILLARHWKTKPHACILIFLVFFYLLRRRRNSK